MNTTDIKNWTVIIVDDEPHNVGVAQKILTFNGAQVYTATDGLKGLKLLQEINPTFILLDLSMPNMDGWEMHRQLRSQHNTRGIPVIALTAHAMLGDRERVIEEGFDGYIAKPFRIGSFLDNIHDCLSSSSQDARGVGTD